MRPSKNLPLPLRIYPLFNKSYVRPYQNLPLPSKIYPPPFSTTICDPPRIYPSLPEYTPFLITVLYATLSESTPLSQNIPPPFSTTICDPPRIYSSLPEYTPFSITVLYATLPESTPPSQNMSSFSTNLYVRPSHNLPLPPRIYPPLFNNYMRPCQNLPYPSLPEYTPPPPFNNYMRHFQNLPVPLRIYTLSTTII